MERIKMKIYCCKEHVEIGLDNIVDEAEVPPFIDSLSDKENGEVTNNLGDFTCEYCGKPAVYVVASEH